MLSHGSFPSDEYFVPLCQELVAGSHEDFMTLYYDIYLQNTYAIIFMISVLVSPNVFTKITLSFCCKESSVFVKFIHKNQNLP
jgi:hypothetical protein